MAQDKAVKAPKEPACAVCGVEGGHAPGCWVGQAAIAPPAAEKKAAPADDEE